MCNNNFLSEPSKLSFEIYRIHQDNFFHQDNLYWGTMHFFIALQIAIVTGGYKFFNDKNFIFLILTLIFGLVLNGLLYFLMSKNKKDRNANLEQMKDFEENGKFFILEKTTVSGNIIWHILFLFFITIYIIAIGYSIAKI